MKKAALSLFTLMLAVCVSFAGKDILELKGAKGPGKGKTIVLVSGDEEYRTEESMPMLAKILSQKARISLQGAFCLGERGQIHRP